MRKILCTLGCFMLLMISIVGVSTNEVWADTKDDSYTIINGDDYYGTLYGSQYSADDDSKWVTLKMGGQGFRIVNQDDNEIIMVDKYGGIYINGEQVDQKDDQRVPYGFLYLLVVISLLLNVINFIRRNKLEKKK